MSDDYGNLDVNLAGVNEAGNSEPAPPGTHLCRLEVDPLGQIGQNLGWRVKGRVVETNHHGKLVEDVLFFTDAALPRLITALHRIGGLNKLSDGNWPNIKARDVVERLNGKLGRLTVEKVTYNVKGDSKTEYSEAQALEMRVRGEKVYGHARITFAGYESPTAEEIQKYGEVQAPASSTTGSNGSGAAQGSAGRLPF